LAVDERGWVWRVGFVRSYREQPRCVWGPLGSLDAAQVRLGSFGESGCSPGAFGVLWGVWIEFKVVKSRAHH
jgi:hypothetical protein